MEVIEIVTHVRTGEKTQVRIPDGYQVVKEGVTEEGDKIYELGTGFIFPQYEPLVGFGPTGVDVDEYYIVIRPVNK